MPGTHVLGVKFERIGRPLRARPEEGAGRGDGVLWHRREQLLDLARVVVLKLEPRPSDALLERNRLGGDEVLVDVVQLLIRLARVLERRLDKVGLRQVEIDVCRRVDKKRVEPLAGPL